MQQKIIEKAVQRSAASPAFSEELVTMLFTLLIPGAIKEHFTSETNLVLVLDRDAAQYPWELLAGRTETDEVVPFGTRMGLIRQFKTATYTQGVNATRSQTALVVGVPKNSGGDLPSARAEAIQVAAMLRNAGYDVPDGVVTDADTLQVYRRLFAGGKGYKILHLAGHGQYVAGKPDKSGMILDEDTCLGTKAFRNLDPLPELVFINCCHLGKIDEGEPRLRTDSPHVLAASVAEELIKLGVKAVVAAGWAVEDKAASAFAEIFYREMLDGVQFGTAVLRARIAAYNAAPTFNTWGAYQCYGHPEFVLTGIVQDRETSGSQEPRPYLQREAMEKLAEIQADAAGADALDRVELGEALKELYAGMPDDPALLQLLGDAWDQLGYFDEAVKSYRQALDKDEKAETPMSLIERLATALIHNADDVLAQQADDPSTSEKKADPIALIDEASSYLEPLLKLTVTPERLSLLGGVYKRKASVAKTAEDVRTWLERAKNSYAKAHELSKVKTGKVNPYPALNFVTVRFLLGDKEDIGADIIEESVATARTSEKMEPSLWNRVTEADAELLRHLVAGDLPEHVDNVLNLYRGVLPRVTRRETAAIFNQFGFIVQMLEIIGDKTPKTDDNINALNELRSKTREMIQAS
jgi:tetratricopeptide (TPR) repeat protein